MKPPDVSIAVAGIGVWSPGFAGWPAFRKACLQIEVVEPTTPQKRPTPLLLPPVERRRVPDGVAVALEVAREALASAVPPIDPASLASVFASAHGELAIVDYLCETLASDPLSLSPIRFHHSVHNAAAGYWGIATPSVGPSTSIAAGDDSFALGLLEAATQVVAEDRPVLLVVFDTPAVGLLADAVANTTLFGAALLLTPLRADHTGPSLSIESDQGSYERDDEPLSEAVATLATSSPAASAVWLLDALAREAETTIDFPLQAAPTVSVNIRFGGRP